MTDRERYESHIDRSGGPDECHLWLLKPNRHGYGQIMIGGRNGRKYEAHRYGYQSGGGTDALGYELGPLTSEFHVCHTCDNPLCQNQGHWFRGTRSDNMKDCVSKGRNRKNYPTGTDHPAHKLSEDQRADICRRYARGGITQRELGEEYGVVQQTISLIIKNGAHAK